MRIVSALTALAVVLLPAAAMAADAAHPYANVNRRVDAGNSTGDAQVDGLNQAQLSAPGSRANGVGSPAASPSQANPYYPYAPPPGAAAQPRPAVTGYAVPAYPVRPYYASPVYVAAPPVFYPAPLFYPTPFFYPRPFFPY